MELEENREPGEIQNAKFEVEYEYEYEYILSKKTEPEEIEGSSLNELKAVAASYYTKCNSD